jgi:hypothetical protein
MMCVAHTSLWVTTRLWNVSVTNDIHNHELDSALQGHLIAGRLKSDEKELLEELTRNLVAPKNIMSAMKERDPDNVTNARQIYNARWRFTTRIKPFCDGQKPSLSGKIRHKVKNFVTAEIRQ